MSRTAPQVETLQRSSVTPGQELPVTQEQKILNAEFDHLSAPRGSGDHTHTRFRAFSTWPRWEKVAEEIPHYSFDALPSFLFNQERLTRQAENELIAVVRGGGAEGDEARAVLLTANLRLVRHLASRYIQMTTPACGMDDLFQEGVKGLHKAIDLYDPEKSHHGGFAVYASKTIVTSMHRAIRTESDTVYYPERYRRAAWTVLRTAEDLTHTLGRDPTYGEVAQTLAGKGCTLNVTPDFIAYLFSEGILQDHPAIENDFREHEPQLLPSANTRMPGEVHSPEILDEIGRIARECYADFPQRVREILEMRYPTDSDQEPKTLEEVGEIYGLSKQRIGQIETQAFERLRKRLGRRGIGPDCLS